VIEPADDAAGAAPAAPRGRSGLHRLPSRLYALVMAVLLAVVWVVVGFAFATVESLYPGTGVATGYPVERPAVGQVGECRRAGPLSVNGFGYWWECRVRIRTDDGRVVQTVLRHSMVTPADAGRPVELREACFGADNTRCRYGRPVSRGFAVALRFLRVFERAVNLAFLFLVCLYLLGLVLGERRYDAVMARIRRRRERKVW
jgi:Family of unknown function (DUF6346)